MSDVLKGQVPEFDEEPSGDQHNAAKHVILIAEKVTGGRTSGMVGVLRGILLGIDPEIEFRVELKEALDILQANNLVFTRFELHYGEDIVVPIPGPFIVKAARIDEISPVDQLCTLGLHLTKQSR